MYCVFIARLFGKSHKVSVGFKDDEVYPDSSCLPPS